MSTNSTCRSQFSSACSRVHGNRFADDKAIADQFSDGLSRVCVGNFVDLVRIEPNLAFTAAHDGRGEALLGSKVHPGERDTSATSSFRDGE